MKIKVLLLTVVMGCATATLFADEGWGYGYGYDDGARDGDWSHRDYGYNTANPAQRQQFLTANPGVKKFIDEKTATGATVLSAGLERDWTNGVSGEVAVSENNKVTVYYINTRTGAVITQHDAVAGGWGW